MEKIGRALGSLIYHCWEEEGNGSCFLYKAPHSPVQEWLLPFMFPAVVTAKADFHLAACWWGSCLHHLTLMTSSTQDLQTCSGEQSSCTQNTEQTSSSPHQCWRFSSFSPRDDSVVQVRSRDRCQHGLSETSKFSQLYWGTGRWSCNLASEMSHIWNGN